MYHTDDTIAAIASAAGGAARGIVRLSGPRTVEVVARCFRPAEPRSLADIRRDEVVAGRLVLDGSRLDAAPADLYLWPTERSYTRQPAAELHTLGSPPLLSALVAALCASGARAAEPGEFTLRAFLAGRIDLTQAEAVLGVIEAREPRELDAALAQLAGGLARPLAALRGALVDLLAELEAGLDFVEEDIRFITAEAVAARLDEARRQLEAVGRQLAERARFDELPAVALIGWPNVGKSSLYNALTESGALVSDKPGTTRDYLSAVLALGDVRCQLIDTAGFEVARPEDLVGHGAQQASAAQTAACQLRLLCLDATRPLNDWERGQLTAPAAEQLVVLTKCDRDPAGRPPAGAVPGDAIATSAVTGQGLAALREAIRRSLAQPRQPGAAAMSAERCRDSLRAAAESLERAAGSNAAGAGDELTAAEIRAALNELGKVVGAVYTDDILERIFTRFCIGK